MEQRVSIKRDVAIVLILVVAATVAHHRVLRAEFLLHDDDLYVTDNAVVRDGLTIRGVAWAFTTGRAANWHPVTWLSHMLDVELFGLNFTGHHAVGLALHALNAALLYAALRYMTRAAWPSALVAALFAIHPIHVETVAWVAERKGLLSTTFWMLTMVLYARYVNRPSRTRYGLVALFLALGLMAKQMLVTLPFVLLLLDCWPLERMPDRTALRACLCEKIPFIALSGVFCVVAFVAQRAGGAMEFAETLSPADRVANALVSYWRYAGKAVWPWHLSPIYPHPRDTTPLWQAAVAAIALVSASAGALYFARRRPYLAVGWLWYVGTLVPVIGLVQVSYTSMADRYAYVPLVGLYIAVAWGLREVAQRSTSRAVGASVLAVLVVSALGVLTFRQSAYWRDSESLFRQAVRAVPDNAPARIHLGIVYMGENRHAEAVSQFEAAVKADPQSVKALTGLGAAYRSVGRLEDAVAAHEAALRVDPNQSVPHANIGVALIELDRPERAEGHLREAVRLDPDNAHAHLFLGVAMARQGEHTEAKAHVRQALRLQPDYPLATDVLALLENEE